MLFCTKLHHQVRSDIRILMGSSILYSSGSFLTSRDFILFRSINHVLGTKLSS
ncbi:hypothetical protein HanXRQr2_Chr10g0428981 [Helianthus annuus]|uniref:Uncharacterized protein n=1 Tax=Helianthus annuus TaxID=4232 RepID=A0A9K3HVG6_HELAN|nr:hypothetical protein HanXRQr2_Chr10g0428981 [Helianthus annuus]